MSFRIIKYLTPIIQPVYRKYLSKTRKYRYNGIRIRVNPTVFYPGFVFSTKIFLRFLEGMDLHGKRVLDLGSGSGILSILAARKGAMVTATDINPAAVEDIRENARQNEVHLAIIESDLFQKIPETKFDLVLITPPYYPKDPGNFGEMAWFCGTDFGYFEKLFSQLPGFCTIGTTVFMILSEDCDIPKITSVAAKNNLELLPVHRKKKFGEWNFIYRVILSSSLKDHPSPVES